MKRRAFLAMVAGVGVAARFARADGEVADGVLFRDRFDGKLADGWTWIREEPKHWRVGDQGLEVHVQPGNMWGPKNDAKNLLVRAAPALADQQQALQVTASVRNHPTHQYEQVDLTWYVDDANMVKVGQELVDGKLSIVMGREEKDKTRTISITPLDSDEVQLRYVVHGKSIRGSFKTPNGEWREVGECEVPTAGKGEARVCLQFYQGPADEEHWARVRELVVRGV
jgi:regulation of enolase protein 1 (concanavalin A-like superfamily)